MTTWYHVKPFRLNSGDELIEAVNVTRETDSFLWVDEVQTWDGKRVVRQRRVAKQQNASYRGSYFPTRIEALLDMQHTATYTLEKLRKELEETNKHLYRIIAALEAAQQEQAQ